LSLVEVGLLVGAAALLTAGMIRLSRR
jgi:hypothetical protein